MSATAVIDARKAATVFARVRPPRSHVQKGTIRPVVTHRDSLTERPTMATSTLDGVSTPMTSSTSNLIPTSRKPEEAATWSSKSKASKSKAW